jgi:hypothetical protein
MGHCVRREGAMLNNTGHGKGCETTWLEEGKVQGDVFDAWAYASSLDGDEC